MCEQIKGKNKRKKNYFLILCLSLCLSFLPLAPITPTPLQGFLKTISCLWNKNNSFSPLLPILPIPSSHSLSPSLIPCSLWHPCHERDEERERQITPLSCNDPVKCHCYTHTIGIWLFAVWWCQPFSNTLITHGRICCCCVYGVSVYCVFIKSVNAHFKTSIGNTMYTQYIFYCNLNYNASLEKYTHKFIHTLSVYAYIQLILTS